MLVHELRHAYLRFFEGKDHSVYPSASLEPVDVLGAPDETTLFTGSGMQQFKPWFSGAAVPAKTRIATVQKCLRTGDIDSVGDYSHCTFFEMLGNFSFGDYFKAEVIPWTWEFLTETLGIDGERLAVTVYKDDDEAYGIWRDTIGLSEDRIHRLDEDKNFWPASAVSEGPNGVCGPCSEIYYPMVPESEMCADSSLSPTERFKIDDDAGRWLEIWNNVFTQFDRSEDEEGQPVLTPLPKKNNDTGAGLDRIVCVLQGVRSVFETDLFRPILAEVERLSGQSYTGTMGPKDFAFRVVAEHLRSMVFCIADGILPGNEGRSYVLRYIMRRAIRYGKTGLGLDDPFLHKAASKVIEQMGGHYSELRERSALIEQTILGEEERFLRTLASGMARFEEMAAALADRSLSGRDAFTLYDTFGFPLELTKDFAAERGMTVDLDGFEAAMEAQRRRSREAGGDRAVFGDASGAAPALDGLATEFFGYTNTDLHGRVLAIRQAGTQATHAGEGEEAEVVLDRTPFYAESGGQVGDTGTLETDGFRAEVLDTRKQGGVHLHRVRVTEGKLAIGQEILARVDAPRRLSIMRNHTATHLLHAALRQTLGSHVHQKGSLVAPDRLRFDFTHSRPVSQNELAQVEAIVNDWVLRDEKVEVHADVPLADAKSRGAMALFGEKYGERVRMVEVPGFSLELCGGTHLQRTSQTGLFRIVQETGVASGVRRIEALTGEGAVQSVVSLSETLALVARTLKASERDVAHAVERLVAQRAELDRQVRELRARASDGAASLKVEDVGTLKLVSGVLAGADGEALAAASDRALQENPGSVVLLASTGGAGALFACKVSPDLVKQGIHAGNLVREAAKVAGGGGGGRPDFAQAGGKDPEKVGESLEAARRYLAGQAQRPPPQTGDG